MSDLLTHLTAQLGVEEGKTFFIYDDAKGPHPFRAGDTLVGKLTCASGVNLSAGLDSEEVTWLTAHRAQKIVDSLLPFPWYARLDQVRAAAIADIAFNIGATGLMHWPKFLSDLAVSDFSGAGKEIDSNTLWISQVHPDRAMRIKQMIITGEWPEDVKV